MLTSLTYLYSVTNVALSFFLSLPGQPPTQKEPDPYSRPDQERAAGLKIKLRGKHRILTLKALSNRAQTNLNPHTPNTLNPKARPNRALPLTGKLFLLQVKGDDIIPANQHLPLPALPRRALTLPNKPTTLDAKQICFLRQLIQSRILNTTRLAHSFYCELSPPWQHFIIFMKSHF